MKFVLSVDKRKETLISFYLNSMVFKIVRKDPLLTIA